ncbi:hypothetical protein NDN08_003911 [Rhodosorus marinus]|uniref:BTB domain-containing protein n=1 Tax=Rhodosorus marinus TaxID=101924 RepID=A0AAV8UGT0_9RHOD|nr:hypothetical protein NDN08_003911 [Rhodosorus marinus]
MDVIDTTRWNRLKNLRYDHTRMWSENKFSVKEDAEFPSRRRSCVLYGYQDGDSFWMYGGEGNSYLNDTYRLDVQEQYWNSDRPDGDPPPACFGFSGTFDSRKGLFYVFGGFDGTSYHGDVLYVLFLSTISPRWTRMKLSGDVSVATRRCSHAASLLDGSLYVFGGVNEAGYLWQPFKIDVETGRVTALEDSSELPRRGHAAVSIDKHIYIVGGEYNGKYLFDLMQMDQAGRVARLYFGRRFARRGHSLVAFGKQLYIFGGFNGKYLNDVVVCDTETGYVEVQYPVTDDGFAPRGRSYHGAMVVSGKMYIFGGADGGLMNDLYSYQLGTAHSIEHEELKSLSSLVSELEKMVDNESMSDVKLVCDDDSTISAHGFVLAARSLYFRSVLSNGIEKDGVTNLKVGGVSRELLLEFLQYLYTGRLPHLEDVCIEMIPLADRHGSTYLKEHCKEVAVVSISQESVGKRLEQARRLKLEFLRESCMDYVVENFENISVDEWIASRLPSDALSKALLEVSKRPEGDRMLHTMKLWKN